MAPILSRLNTGSATGGFGFGRRRVSRLVSSGISATGGTIVDNAGYRIHVFTSPGSFVVTVAGTGLIEYVVVAGGGSGGSNALNSPFGQVNAGGGGGAGGFRTAIDFPITATTYPITIGGGGTAATPAAGTATNGNPSIFSTITSTGGGRGGYRTSPAVFNLGQPGGSGGGNRSTDGASGTGNTPATTPSQGNPGGPRIGASPNPASYMYGGSGGGGAGATGGTNGGGVVSPTNDTGGVGGDGSPITWIPASYGTPGPAPGRYFAGGGGGGTQEGPTTDNAVFNIAPGGAGGGGAGSNSPAVGTPGTTNTGGGGGGGAGWYPTQTTNRIGGNGGSGIVMIRYVL